MRQAESGYHQQGRSILGQYFVHFEWQVGRERIAELVVEYTWTDGECNGITE